MLVGVFVGSEVILMTEEPCPNPSLQGLGHSPTGLNGGECVARLRTDKDAAGAVSGTRDEEGKLSAGTGSGGGTPTRPLTADRRPTEDPRPETATARRDEGTAEPRHTPTAALAVDVRRATD